MRAKQLTAATAAVAALATVVAPLNSVFAATAPTWSTGSSATIRREIANAYGTINNTFTYTITADTSNPTGATGAPTSASAVFNGTYTTQGTATQTATLDFSSMQFDQVGDYSYAIAETASTNASIYPVDSTSTYTATVSVRNNNNLTGFVASLYIKDKDGNKLTNISGNTSEVLFASAPSYTNVQVSHTVSGNAADPSNCFEYTFSVNTTDSYTLTTESTCTNSSTIANGGTISLKHGDTATIGLVGTTSQIPVGTTYGFTKSGTDEYTTSIDGTARTTISKTMVATNASNYSTNNTTAIDEHLESSVDTNAFINMTIYILLALAGISGIAFFVYKKRSSQNQEA